VYIKLVVLLRNYVTMMHGQQNIKNGWATIVVVGRLRVNTKDYLKFYSEDKEFVKFHWGQAEREVSLSYQGRGEILI
jgi:hypothetical protein